MEKVLFVPLPQRAADVQWSSVESSIRHRLRLEHIILSILSFCKQLYFGFARLIMDLGSLLVWNSGSDNTALDNWRLPHPHSLKINKSDWDVLS